MQAQAGEFSFGKRWGVHRMKHGLFERLREIVGASGLMLDGRPAPHHLDFSAERIVGPVMIKPRSTAQVSGVLASCNASAQPLMICSGASAGRGIASTGPGEVMLALDRMDAIESIDPLDRTVLLEAGVQVRSLHERAAAYGLSFPTGLGGIMPGHVGGCAATSMGGAHGFRQGPMRQQVLGLEVVLADGRIISSLNRPMAGSVGLDLKQLFIGSGGTLGVITRLALRLHAKPASRCTVLVSVQEFDQLTELFRMMERALQGSLDAFEFLDRDFYAMSGRHSHAASPLARGCPHYAIIESAGFDAKHDGDLFESAVRLGLKNGLIFDAVIARTDDAQRAIWNLHHNLRHFAHCYCPFDVFTMQIPAASMEPCMDAIRTRIRARWPDASISFAGSIANATLHAALSAGRASREDRQHVSRCVHEALAACGGAAPIVRGMDAGDGFLSHAGCERADLDLIQGLKAFFDPNDILNPVRPMP